MQSFSSQNEANGFCVGSTQSQSQSWDVIPFSLRVFFYYEGVILQHRSKDEDLCSCKDSFSLGSLGLFLTWYVFCLANTVTKKADFCLCHCLMDCPFPLEVLRECLTTHNSLWQQGHLELSLVVDLLGFAANFGQLTFLGAPPNMTSSVHHAYFLQ